MTSKDVIEIGDSDDEEIQRTAPALNSEGIDSHVDLVEVVEMVPPPPSSSTGVSSTPCASIAGGPHVSFGDGGVSSSSAGSLPFSTTCYACHENGPLDRLYSLDPCNHKLCSHCAASAAATALTGVAACPVCKKELSVRDVRLLLSNTDWRTLQQRRLQKFRALLAQGGASCPACLTPLPLFFGTSSQHGSTMQSRCDGSAGVAKTACGSCGAVVCRLCRAAWTGGHACSTASLLGLEVLLRLLEQHWTTD
ncbi:unnamed protein product, partial [Phaeothamnion confervicola]